MKPPSKPPQPSQGPQVPANATGATAGLKLIALDHEDLVVLAAHLQDAVGVIGDMTFLPKERRFVALLNRFDWAAESDAKTPGVRRRAALRIEQARRAQVQGIDLKAKGAVINLLTAVFEPDADAAKMPAGCLTLVCAGGAAIRLDVDCIEVQLEDLGPAWAAKAVPRHED
jgi:hypothetical protein